MALYRGVGGVGDANNDVTINEVQSLASDAALSKSYAEEWANKAEDSLVSTDAGGDSVDDYSALHHSAKASLAQTAAELAETNASADAVQVAADLVQTNLDTIATAADLVQTNLDTIATAADKVATNADVLLTNADVVLTAADVVTSGTNAGTAITAAGLASTSASEAAADLVQTNLDTIATAADVVTTNADVVLTNADVVTTGNNVTAAQLAETNAQAAQTAAELAYDNFDDRYLGSKASDPTLDNDGAALLTGAEYFNTTINRRKVYNGSTWQLSTADAVDVNYTATGNIVATDVQAAINELDTEKQAQSSLLDDAVAENAIGRRNFIINGVAPYINQEGNKTNATTDEYAADVFKYRTGAGAGVTNIGVYPIGVYDMFGLDVTTGDASIGAVEYYLLEAFVEGYDAFPLLAGYTGAKTITISFRHRHTQTGTYCVAVKNAAFDRYYIFEYTQSLSNAVEQHSETITLDTTGTWDNTSGAGIRLVFAAAMGVDFQGTSGSWQAGDEYITSNQVNGVSTAGNTFLFSDLQLEIGSVATEPEYIPYAEKLGLVQRYFVDCATSSNLVIMPSASEGATSYNSGIYQLPVVMRAAPTFTATSWSAVGHHANAPTIVSDPTHVLLQYSGSNFRAAGIRLVAPDAAADARL